MTRQEAQAKFDAKINALTVDAAIQCYTMLRQSTYANRKNRDVAQAMVLCGNSLEARIGEEAFEMLMDEIDGVGA